MTLAPGWDDPATAAYYESFCDNHPRYAQSNARLVEAAQLRPGQRVLDFGAGTGRTARAIVDACADVELWCVEPAAAMAEVGRTRVPSARWVSGLQEAPGSFDRVIANAVVWLLEPLEAGLRALAERLAPGGRLHFDIPGLYLGQGDDAGGGRDARLIEVFEHLPPRLPVSGQTSPPSIEQIETTLGSCGLTLRRFGWRQRLGQLEYRDWLKIPPASGPMLATDDPQERVAILDDAFSRTDPASWRWESWIAWEARRSDA